MINNKTWFIFWFKFMSAISIIWFYSLLQALFIHRSPKICTMLVEWWRFPGVCPTTWEQISCNTFSSGLRIVLESSLSFKGTDIVAYARPLREPRVGAPASFLRRIPEYLIIRHPYLAFKSY